MDLFPLAFLQFLPRLLAGSGSELLIHLCNYALANSLVGTIRERGQCSSLVRDAPPRQPRFALSSSATTPLVAPSSSTLLDYSSPLYTLSTTSSHHRRNTNESSHRLTSLSERSTPSASQARALGYVSTPPGRLLGIAEGPGGLSLTPLGSCRRVCSRQIVRRPPVLPERLPGQQGAYDRCVNPPGYSEDPPLTSPRAHRVGAAFLTQRCRLGAWRRPSVFGNR